MMHTRCVWAITVSVVVAGAAVAPAASAQPPGFPDINNFADVTSSYMIPGGRGDPGVLFSTPDGLSCGFAAPQSVTADNPPAHCDGFLPGVSGLPVANDQAGDCDIGRATTDPPEIWHHRSSCNPPSAGNKILNPGQKVTYGHITCGVAPGGVTACLDTANGEHGFVLQPSGSSAF
jgi:hypothetical protein